MKSLPTKQTRFQGLAERRRSLPSYLNLDTCLAFRLVLKHCNQCRALGCKHLVLLWRGAEKHFCLSLESEGDADCCSREDPQSVCHRSKGWFLMSLHAHLHRSLFSTLSYHLKSSPCTCFVINNVVRKRLLVQTQSAVQKDGFSSGALIGLKPLGMPFRFIHPVNHPQPAPSLRDQCQAKLPQGPWKNMIYFCAQINSPCKMSGSWVQLTKSISRRNSHLLCLARVCLVPPRNFSSIIYNLWANLSGQEDIFFL